MNALGFRLMRETLLSSGQTTGILVMRSLFPNKGFPRLFSYVKDPWISVKEFFCSRDILRHFHLPLSAQAFGELGLIKSFMGSHNRTSGTKDVWFWQNSSKQYRAKMFYSHTFQS